MHGSYYLVEKVYKKVGKSLQTEDPLTQSAPPGGDLRDRVGGMILNSLFFKEPLYNIACREL